jgi:hypothetical protein
LALEVWGTAWPDHPATDVAGFVTSRDAPDRRLATFRAEWGPAAEQLVKALASGFAARGGLALRLGAPLS